MVSIYRTSLRRYAWAFGLCAILLGSVLYVGAQSFAIGSILVFMVGPFLVLHYAQSTHEPNALAFVMLALGVVVVLSVAALAVYPTYANLQYFKAFLFAFFAIPIVSYMMRNRSVAAGTGLYIYIVVICAIAVSQLSYLYIGVGLDPVRVASKSYVADNPFQYAGIRSIFGNPNDFATICVLCTLVVLYRLEGYKRQKVVASTVMAIMIVFCASRICIVCEALVLGTYYLMSWRRWRYVLYTMLVFIVIVYASNVFSGRLGQTSYWYTKISSMTNVAVAYAHGGLSNVTDGSVDMRATAYLHFVRNFYDIGFGSFQAQDYNYFFNQPLFQQDPHSLMIELSVLYGYVGFIVYWIIVLSILFSLSHKYNRVTGLLLSLCIVLLTFTSSSEINIPAFWVLLAMIVCDAPTGRAVQGRRANVEYAGGGRLLAVAEHEVVRVACSWANEESGGNGLATGSPIGRRR